MPAALRVLLVLSLLGAGLLPAAPAAQAAPLRQDAPAQAAGSQCAPDGIQPSGAVFRLCMPTGVWNRELVVYAHGYVAYNEPIAIPEDQLGLEDGPTIPQIVNGLGYGFATTSYRVNGLAVRQGIEDILELVQIFAAVHGTPERVYLVGPSEGGVITALTLEKYPQIFAGGVSACGPVGNFRAQINYWGDVRVIFDYLYPGLLPGSPTHVPQRVIDNWESFYEPRIEAAFRNDAQRRQEFMTIAGIPGNPLSLDDTIDQLVTVMWYNAFATNDGIEKLGGQPFDNSRRWYRGSSNDVRMNLLVPRFTADPAAVGEMDTHYQTSGILQKPIVMLHTVDPLIPLWHELIYSVAVSTQGSKALHTSLPILWRYGHCNFTVVQLLVAFVVMVRETTGATLADAERVLATPAQQQEFRELMEQLPELENQPLPPLNPVYLPLLPSGALE